ncbi:MAG: class I adenylate-forming enzyme family protein [Thermodesulfobacteriota bacterium]
MRAKLVNNFLEDSARRRPDKTALVAGPQRRTYLELDAMSDALAASLVAEGLQKGERVAVLLDNSVEAVVSIFGILKAAGVFLMVNPSTKEEKLTYILNNCRASALIVPANKLKALSGVCSSVRSLTTLYAAGELKEGEVVPGKAVLSLSGVLGAGAPAAPARRPIDADLATIIYTSGSTGNPKGVMMTHLNMVCAADSITSYLENTEDDIILNTLPLSFDYGLYQVLMAFKVSATVILEKSFTYPYKVLNTMITERVTGFPIVPTISAILSQMESLNGQGFDSLRYITNTADALPLSHIENLKKIFPGARIFSMYGLTECKRVAYLPPDEVGTRPASVGKAMPNTEAFIVDENGVRVGPGVIGELVVRGNHLMRGYWEMPEETAKMLRPGEYPGDTLLYTGDLFRADDDGYLYFVARKHHMIKCRGEKVSPVEVENVLYGIDDVVEAVVTGEPDPVLGEAIKAFVVLRESSALMEKDLLAYCSRHLEDHMVPQRIEFVKELPRTASGKIHRARLGKVPARGASGVKSGTA